MTLYFRLPHSEYTQLNTVEGMATNSLRELNSVQLSQQSAQLAGLGEADCNGEQQAQLVFQRQQQESIYIIN